MAQLLKICSTVLWPGLKPACSSAQQFLSLGLESVEDNSEHGLAGMADFLTLLAVAFLW